MDAATIYCSDLVPNEDTKVKFFEGARNNLADSDSYATAMKIQDFAMKLGKDDIMLTLISGWTFN